MAWDDDAAEEVISTELSQLFRYDQALDDVFAALSSFLTKHIPLDGTALFLFGEKL